MGSSSPRLSARGDRPRWPRKVHVQICTSRFAGDSVTLVSKKPPNRGTFAMTTVRCIESRCRAQIWWVVDDSSILCPKCALDLFGDANVQAKMFVGQIMGRVGVYTPSH